jgi:phenolic acid decarboxylase
LKRLLSQLLEYELQKHLIINFRQSYSTAVLLRNNRHKILCTVYRIHGKMINGHCVQIIPWTGYIKTIFKRARVNQNIYMSCHESFHTPE